MTNPRELYKAGVIGSDHMWLAVYDFDLTAFEMPEKERASKLEYLFRRIDQLLQRPWEL